MAENKIIDRSLNFGTQNFIYVKGDETGLTYNYYAFINKNGSILIMRMTKDMMEAEYFLGKGVFATIWGDKEDTATVYCLPNELENQTF